jgi:hypothetical protein
MKIVFIVLLGIMALMPITFAQANIKLKIGTKLPRKYLPKEDEQGKQIATHPSQFRPFIEKTVGQIKYLIAYDDKTYKIKYLETRDKRFKTGNGLQVGSKIEVTRDTLTIYGGWYIFAAPTPDGWRPIVGPELPMNENEKSLREMAVGEKRTVTIWAFTKGGN